MGFNVRTIHKHITYEENKSLKEVSVLWDGEDAKIDKIMENEFKPDIETKKLNLMWIEKVKEASNWKLGEKLYIMTKTNCDNCYYCYYSNNKDDLMWVSFIVEKNGYVSAKYFNHYTRQEDEEDEIKHLVLYRPSSVYNDKICDKLKKK